MTSIIRRWQERASRSSRRLLTMLFGLLLAVVTIAVGAPSSTAQNAVGAQRTKLILAAGAWATAAQTHIGVGRVRQLGQASATGVAAESGADANAVIGKVKDLSSVGDNEYTLLDKLPDQGSPKANWAQNSGVLRQEMSRGVPIRDASVGSDGQLIQYPGSFLDAERNLLTTKGWTYDPKTTLWSRGG